MQIDIFLNDRAELKKFEKVDENGMKKYKKGRKIKCYKKGEKIIYQNVGETLVQETIKSAYYVKENQVKKGDLIDDCEVYQIQHYKKIRLDAAYVK